MAAAATGTRQQIAFYGSTPAYRAVLDLHGWGGLQEELNALSKQGQWAEMGELIDDEILETFAVVAEPEAVAPELHRRYGDVIQRITFYAPYQSDPDRWLGIIEALKAGLNPDLSCRRAEPRPARATPRGTARGTWPAGACPRRSWAACPASPA